MCKYQSICREQTDTTTRSRPRLNERTFRSDTHSCLTSLNDLNATFRK